MYLFGCFLSNVYPRQMQNIATYLYYLVHVHYSDRNIKIIIKIYSCFPVLMLCLYYVSWFLYSVYYFIANCKYLTMKHYILTAIFLILFHCTHFNRIHIQHQHKFNMGYRSCVCLMILDRGRLASHIVCLKTLIVHLEQTWSPQLFLILILLICHGHFILNNEFDM